MTDALFSRDEVLSGLPARRARTLLYLTESRVGRLVAQEHDVAEDFPTDLTAKQRDQEFLEAFLDGRDPPLRPTIQDLERHAAKWASLVPDNLQIRAGLAQQLGQKYQFTARDVPRIRAVVGLDLDAVQRAYTRLHGRPIETIYAPGATLGERARWAASSFAAWIDGIPPFWATFVLTVTFNTSQAFLALPVALAGIGPLAGAAVLLVLGIVNVLTITAMAEAVGRSGSVRFGRAYLGRLVADYLGVAGSLILTISIALRYALGVLANYVGLSTTLQTSTGLAATAWVPILFLAGLYFLWRGSLKTTLSMMVLLGLVNLGLLGLIALLALPYADMSQLLYHNVPILDAVSLGDRVVQPVLGVVLIAYFGHAYVNQIANGVLPRDPSARSLIWGSVAGIACTMVFYVAWALATSASAGVQALAATSSTALSPLAERIGPSVQILGSILALSLLGMSLLRNQNVLFNLVLERLPARRSSSPQAEATGRGRFMLAVAPIVGTFLVTEWLLWIDQASYTRPLSVAGVIIVSLLAGMFPVLLLVASRRRGELVPLGFPGWLGHPIVVGAIYLFYMVALLSHGLVIWDWWVERASALLAGATIAVATVVMVRHGAFKPRLVVELRDGGVDEPLRLHVTFSGRPLVVKTGVETVRGDHLQHTSADPLPPLDALRAVTIDLPETDAYQLKVWLHRPNGDGRSDPIAARIRLDPCGEVGSREADLVDGQVVLPLRGARSLRIQLEQRHQTADAVLSGRAESTV